MAEDHVFRFAVGGPGVPRSAIWRLFTSGAEVYLGVRQIAGIYKVSFHSSGVCQEAFTSVIATGAERRSHRWHRSSPATKITELYRVAFVSRLCLRPQPVTAKDSSKALEWLPPVSDGGIGTARLFVGPTSGPILSNALAWPLSSGETVYFQYDIGPEPPGLMAGYNDLIRRAAEVEPTLINGPWPASAQPRGVIFMTDGLTHLALDLTADVRVTRPADGAAA